MFIILQIYFFKKNVVKVVCLVYVKISQKNEYTDTRVLYMLLM
jgi:hypothetical protein